MLIAANGTHLCVCGNRHFPILKYFSSCREAVFLKLKVPLFSSACKWLWACIPPHGGPHLSWRSHLLQTSMPLRGTSTVLLKLKGGDHVLLHVASTCHSQGDLPRKERWKMFVYFIAKKREGSKMKSA